ncbi:MAG: hypothetical protein ACLVCH_04010 [Roseburia inulinivorans]
MAKNLMIQDEPVYNEQMEALEPTTPKHMLTISMSDIPSFLITKKLTAEMQRYLKMM